MNSNARYVFDTNVLVSALIFEHSKPGQAFTSSPRADTSNRYLLPAHPPQQTTS